MPVIRPSLPRTHHHGPHIPAVKLNSRQSPSIDILTLDGHKNMLIQSTLHQHLTRGLTAKLANFGRIDTFNAQFERRATRIGLHPERVAIGNVRDKSGVNPCCICVSSYKNKSKKKRFEKHDY